MLTLAFFLYFWLIIKTKSMKKFLLAALLITGMSTFAQEITKADFEQPKKEKLTPAERTQKLTTELGLDEKQQVKVKEVFIKQEKTNADLKQEYKAANDASKAAVREKIKNENVAFRASLKEILTKEQYTKWETSAKRKPSMGTVKGPLKKD
jgi:hypothetical protein